jgi:hypothetical protein
LPAPNEGGVVNCEFCGAKAVIDPRDEVPIAPPDRTPISEEERLTKLRSQDGKPLLPPKGLPAALTMWHGENDPDRAAKGIEVWKKTIAAIYEGGEAVESHEGVMYWLTMVFANYYGSRKEWGRMRGMLETSVEVCRVPSNQQVLRCYIARNAARMDDFTAAREWLGPCDSRSEDLRMDTAWRFTNAQIAICEGDYPTVFEFLGKTFDSVPITQEMDYAASMLRADALERTGELDAAKQTLRDTLSKTHGQPRVFKEIAEQSTTELCPQAWRAVYAPAHRMWLVRYWLFMIVWLGGIGYFAADWAIGKEGDGWSIGFGWLVIPVFIGGWVLRWRWRP